MKYNVVFVRHVRHGFQNRRPLLVMARITADEQHVQRTVLTKGEWRQLGIVCGKEIIRPVPLRLQPRKGRRKIADDNVVTGERYVLKRQRVPTDDALYATGKGPDKIARPARHVQIVEDVCTVRLDLCPQDISQR